MSAVTTLRTTVAKEGLPQRIESIDVQQLVDSLDAQGWARIEGLLTRGDCDELAGMYPDDALFRSRVVMSRHGFGQGEYKYFAYPLPPVVARLREALYAKLVPVANRWHEAMGMATRFPGFHDEFIDRCRQAGQSRPTPLLLRYEAGDYNCLHQDLYGEHVFPLQVVLLLSEPGRDFDGGELVMTEQRPRMQSRPMVLPLRQGDAAVIAVNERPVRGTRGVYRVKLRHGVSRLHAGQRHTAGLVFHDAA